MSNYSAPALNPLTWEVECADWIDNHFGRYAYGVRFRDGNIYTPDKVGVEAAAAELSRLRAEVEAKDAEIADLVDPKLKSMRLENGALDVEVCGAMVQRMALAITGWFRESGAKNYIEMTLHAKDPPFESYTFTIQKKGDGAKTPHELRIAAEQSLARERERCALIAENPGFIQAQDTDWDEGVNYAKRFIAKAIRSLPSEPVNASDGGEA